MTEWDEAELADVSLPSTMNDEERELAEQVYSAIQYASNSSERSLQASEFKIGLSDIGFCSERTRRLIAEIPEVERKDVLEAFLGTAVGDHVEQAMSLLYSNVELGARVAVNLQGDGGTYQVFGHPDLLFPWGVVDVKTVNGLSLVKKKGPTRQQLFQRHTYALGAFEQGYFSIPLNEVKTANVWIDRSGVTKELHVHMDRFDMNVVAEATMWLDDVVYAHLHGEEARKEPPRQMCEKVCGHFLDCRALDTDVTGLITDEELLLAVEVYRDGSSMEKAGKLMKKEATEALRGVAGNTGEFSIRWTHINASPMNYIRNAYDRLNITKQK